MFELFLFSSDGICTLEWVLSPPFDFQPFLHLSKLQKMVLLCTPITLPIRSNNSRQRVCQNREHHNVTDLWAYFKKVCCRYTVLVFAECFL